MGIEENIRENITEISGCEENLSEEYDRLRQEKTERLYKSDYNGTILTYFMLGMMFKCY